MKGVEARTFGSALPPRFVATTLRYRARWVAETFANACVDGTVGALVSLAMLQALSQWNDGSNSPTELPLVMAFACVLTCGSTMLVDDVRYDYTRLYRGDTTKYGRHNTKRPGAWQAVGVVGTLASIAAAGAGYWAFVALVGADAGDDGGSGGGARPVVPGALYAKFFAIALLFLVNRACFRIWFWQDWRARTSVRGILGLELAIAVGFPLFACILSATFSLCLRLGGYGPRHRRHVDGIAKATAGDTAGAGEEEQEADLFTEAFFSVFVIGVIVVLMKIFFNRALGERTIVQHGLDHTRYSYRKGDVPTRYQYVCQSTTVFVNCLLLFTSYAATSYAKFVVFMLIAVGAELVTRMLFVRASALRNATRRRHLGRHTSFKAFADKKRSVAVVPHPDANAAAGGAHEQHKAVAVLHAFARVVIARRRVRLATTVSKRDIYFASDMYGELLGHFAAAVCCVFTKDCGVAEAFALRLPLGLLLEALCDLGGLAVLERAGLRVTGVAQRLPWATTLSVITWQNCAVPLVLCAATHQYS